MAEKDVILAEYLRISKDDGRFGESQSIENQRKLIADYISSRPDLHNKKTVEFIDDGHTGVNFDRPAASQMLSMAKRGEIDCIIVKDFSRFSRDYIEAGDYLEQIFPFLGVRFISVNDGYDSAIHGSLAGDIGNGFKNLYNSYYSKDLSRKVRSGLLTKKLSGTYTPSHCPYGYKKPSHTGQNIDKSGIGMEVDEDAAIIVRRIFTLKIEGKQAPEIARILNLERIPSPLTYQKANGGKIKSSAKSDNPLWSPERIQRIIRDIRYSGIFAYNMYKSERVGEKGSNRLPMEQWTLVPDAIPAIITLEDFEKAQSPKPKLYPKTSRGGKGKRPLARKLICGGCGYALKINEKAHTCHCARKEYTGDTECVGSVIDLAVIENTVITAIQEITHFLSKQTDKKKMASDTHASITDSIKAIQKQIKTANDEKSVLYDKYCNELIARDDYIRLRNEEDETISRLSAELSIAETRHAECNANPYSDIHEHFNRANWNGILSREVSEALINRVLIDKSGRVGIEWAFDYPFTTGQ